MLTQDLSAYLNQRLVSLCPDKGASEGFAIAYSGGGDSTALLHALKDHPALKLVLIVDHGLRKASAHEAAQAQSYAKSLGLDARILKWKTPKGLKTGLQEKARKARYGLIGQACRAANIAYLLTGHTQDDQAETAFMRYERKTDWRGAAVMAPVSRHSLWPELANISLIRPMLDISRQSLRDHNRTHNCPYIDDPSNENAAFTRIAARQYLKTRPDMKSILLEPVADLRKAINLEKDMMREWVETHLNINPNGYVSFSVLPPNRLLYLLLLCVSGQADHISRDKISRLKSLMRSQDFSGATLGGCRIIREGEEYFIFRDMRFSPRLIIKHGVPIERDVKPYDPFAFCAMGQGERWIWDNRFLVRATHAEWQTIAICALPYVVEEFTQTPYFKRLKKDLRKQLDMSSLPTYVRSSLPLHYHSSGKILAFGDVEEPDFVFKSLLSQRLTDMLFV